MIKLTPDFRKVLSFHLGGGVIWTLIAIVFGLLNQLQLMLGWPQPDVLGYGLIRPLFTTSLIFGGIVNLSLAGSYYVMQKSGDLAWQPLALAGFGLQQLGLLLGVIGILLGANKGREYGEMNWVSDHLFFLSLVFFIAVALRSLKKELNAPVLFILAGAAGGAISFMLGNLALPYSPMGEVPLTAGMKDQAVQEFYRISVLGYFVLFPAFGLLYHFIPTHYKLPIYNEGAVRFQALAMLALIPLSGAAYLAYGAGPQMSATFGIVCGIALNFAVIMGAANLLYTVSRGPSRVWSNLDGSYLVWGVRFILILAILRAISLPRFMQADVGYTWWNSRDISQDALVAASVVFAGLAYGYSQRFNQKAAANTLASAALLLAVVGSCLMIVAGTVQGILGGMSARAMTEAGPAVTSFSALLFAGNVAGDTASPTLKFILGLRGIYFLGYASVTVSLATWALSMLSIWRGQGNPFQEADLHLPDEENPEEAR
ncbi:MAG TPA: cbb3-type cytochrome c oxidase subunit I [Leptospiraceae bacterium]|nr:cbb3-type cytochrome c oxidase subunit I [Leptospiraceae bacterium]